MASPSSIPALNPDAPDVVWRPLPDYVERSRLRRFMRTVGVDSYHALLAWAAADPARFWDAAVRDLELEFYQQYTATLDLSRGVPGRAGSRAGSITTPTTPWISVRVAPREARLPWCGRAKRARRAP